MRCGVTGSSGFIGHYFLTYFKKIENKDLIVFDPRVDDIPSNLDEVYHFGFSSVKNYINNPKTAFQEDYLTSEKIAHYCQNNYAHLIFLSSSAVYNLDYQSNYSKSKLNIEKLLNSMYRRKNFPLSIIRLHNPYGYRQSNDFIIPQIFNALITGEKMIIKEPNSVRDFIYIEDCINVLSKLSFYKNSYSTFDLGSGSGVSIKELVNLISKITNIDHKNIIKQNNSKIQSSVIANKNIPFDYTFNFSLQKGLEEVYKFLKV